MEALLRRLAYPHAVDDRSGAELLRVVFRSWQSGCWVRWGPWKLWKTYKKRWKITKITILNGKTHYKWLFVIFHLQNAEESNYPSSWLGIISRGSWWWIHNCRVGITSRHNVGHHFPIPRWSVVGWFSSHLTIGIQHFCRWNLSLATW
jgi:hypothetical protein